MSPGGFRRPPTSYRRARRVDRGAAGGHLVKPEGWPSNWPGPSRLLAYRTRLYQRSVAARLPRDDRGTLPLCWAMYDPASGRRCDGWDGSVKIPMSLVLVSSSKARALVTRRGPNVTTAATPAAAVPTPSRNRRRLIVASNLASCTLSSSYSAHVVRLISLGPACEPGTTRQSACPRCETGSPRPNLTNPYRKALGKEAYSHTQA